MTQSDGSLLAERVKLRSNAAEPAADGTYPFKYEGQPDGCGVLATGCALIALHCPMIEAEHSPPGRTLRGGGHW